MKGESFHKSQVSDEGLTCGQGFYLSSVESFLPISILVATNSNK